jgi:hypothetical protein
LATKALTVRLEPEDYERLEELARQLGVLPGTLARMLIRGSLQEVAGASGRPSLQDVLQRATALRRRLPSQSPLDVVALIQEGRAEPDERLGL